MAQVARTIASQQRVDSYLDYSFGEWQSVPELVEEWPQWEPVDQVTFRHEWAIREDYLDQLQRWAEQGLLTRVQRDRYAELLALVARHRPIVMALFEDDRQ